MGSQQLQQAAITKCRDQSTISTIAVAINMVKPIFNGPASAALSCWVDGDDVCEGDGSSRSLRTYTIYM